MPELPEVETVVRQLRPLLTGRKIAAFSALWPEVTAPHDTEMFRQLVVDQSIVEVFRRAKFILLRLDRGLIHVHLRMTGRLQYQAKNNVLAIPHLSAVMELDHGRLLFIDQRKFGRIGFIDDMRILEAKLGPEPLSPDFTAAVLHAGLQAHQRQIKPLLLDQRFIAGIGNIYADEALYRAKIHPRTISVKIGITRARRLHTAIQSILEQSILWSGTTIQTFQYGAGQAGRFKEHLLVFGRNGQPCNRCKSMIRKIRVAQRGTHYCPACQRK